MHLHTISQTRQNKWLIRPNCLVYWILRSRFMHDIRGPDHRKDSLSEPAYPSLFFVWGFLVGWNRDRFGSELQYSR